MSVVLQDHEARDGAIGEREAIAQGQGALHVAHGGVTPEGLGQPSQLEVHQGKGRIEADCALQRGHGFVEDDKAGFEGEGAADTLDPPLAVRDGALGLAPARRGGQHHVRELGRAGEEDVLDDEVVESLE